uniref:Fanconi anemia group I protein n=1 Tax=Caenorhabditis tropicalis TaxID=1561998 RepID=A0A1I7UZX6_9PELO
MVIKSSPQSLRSVQSRLANRFAQISDRFHLAGSLFTREMLVKNPQSGDLHAVIVHRIILNSIDAAAQSGDPTLRALSAELFGLRVSQQNLATLLNTLDVVLGNNRLKNQNSDVLQLKTLGVSSYRSSLTSLLFEILAVSLGFSTKAGLTIDRKDVIRIIELGINSESRSEAFSCLRSLCINAKYSILPMVSSASDRHIPSPLFFQIPRIVSTLIASLESPDVDLMKTLAFISKTYGPVTSTLYKHFYVIFTALKQPIHQLEYGSHVADLLANCIESAAGVIKPEVFLTVQKAVCESSIMHPDSSIYLQLLSAFLSLNNEFVPSPLHVARSVSARTRSKCEYAHRLRALSNVASRPRTTDLANVKAMKTLILNEEATIRDESPEDIEDPEDVESPDEQEEEPMEVIHVVEEKKIPEEVTASRKKKNSESAPVVVVKKKPKVTKEVKTDLLEGEASVDDILNLFEMD